MPKKIVVPLGVRRAIRWRVVAVGERDHYDDVVKDYDKKIVPWFFEMFKDEDDPEDRKVVTALSGGAGTVTSTLVTPGSDVIDLDELKEHIGARLFKELHTEIPAHMEFDMDKYRQAIKDGRVTPATADAVKHRKSTAPYVKHTLAGGTK